MIICNTTLTSYVRYLPIHCFLRNRCSYIDRIKGDVRCGSGGGEVPLTLHAIFCYEAFSH